MGDFPKKAYDRFATQTPEEAGYYQEDDKCCFCGEELEAEYGHNPYPLREEGRCCGTCNINKVVPERMKRIVGQKTIKLKHKNDFYISIIKLMNYVLINV